MKSLLMLGFAFAALAPVQAQVFRPHGFGGGVFGATVGHGRGEHHGHRWHAGHYASHVGVRVHPGWSRHWNRAHHRHGWPGAYRPYRHHGYRVYRTPAIYAGVVYRDIGYAAGRPDYRGTGLFFGGILGAIVGHNSGTLRHNAWRGAAYGAGLGYIVGSVAAKNARRQEQLSLETEIAAAPAVAPALSLPAAPSLIATRSAPLATRPMSAANALFGR